MPFFYFVSIIQMFIATKANPWNEKGKLIYCTWANVKTHDFFEVLAFTC